MVTEISIDPHAGEVATGRLFSGTIRRGASSTSWARPSRRTASSRSASSWARADGGRESPAGNIAAVTGLRDAIVGSTVTSLRDMTPFESLKHYSEPVMTVAVEAKNMKDLPKLVEVLRQVAKEDPTLKVTINEETGEHLIAGHGRTPPRDRHGPDQARQGRRDHHLAADRGVPRDADRACGPVEGKSPNKHNRFYVTSSPCPTDIVDDDQERRGLHEPAAARAA